MARRWLLLVVLAALAPAAPAMAGDEALWYWADVTYTGGRQYEVSRAWPNGGNFLVHSDNSLLSWRARSAEAFLLRRDGRRFSGLSRLVGYITGARGVRRSNNFPVLVSPQATPGDDGECISTTTAVKIAPLLVVTGSLVFTGDDIAAAVRFPGHEGNPQTRRPVANAAMRETTPALSCTIRYSTTPPGAEVVRDYPALEQTVGCCVNYVFFGRPSSGREGYLDLLQDRL